MEENNRTDLQQPEVTTEYIEYLFSGKKPQKPISKKTWILLGSAILAVVLVCLILPILSAWLLPGYWQDRGASAYEALLAKPAFHFTYQTTEQWGEEAPKVSNKTESWQYGDSYLNITYLGENHCSYRLVVNNQLYTREVTPENPDAPWSSKIGLMTDRVRWSPTLAEAGYVFAKAHGSIAGVDVTYTREGNTDSYLVFHFNVFGKLTGLTPGREYPEEQAFAFVRYTFFDTKPEKIQETISAYRQEAIKKK